MVGLQVSPAFAAPTDTLATVTPGGFTRYRLAGARVVAKQRVAVAGKIQQLLWLDQKRLAVLLTPQKALLHDGRSVQQLALPAPSSWTLKKPSDTGDVLDKAGGDAIEFTLRVDGSGALWASRCMWVAVTDAGGCDHYLYQRVLPKGPSTTKAPTWRLLPYPSGTRHPAIRTTESAAKSGTAPASLLTCTTGRRGHRRIFAGSEGLDPGEPQLVDYWLGAASKSFLLRVTHTSTPLSRSYWLVKNCQLKRAREVQPVFGTSTLWGFAVRGGWRIVRQARELVTVPGGSCWAGPRGKSCLAFAPAPTPRKPVVRALGKELDLLARVRTTVKVSSTVGGKVFLPNHLVDGDLGTAWNSRAGNLVGAWIEAELPKKVTVRAVSLTAGFSGKHAKYGDVFSKNHRITRVRLSHQGKRIADFPLNPANRALQRLTLPRPVVGGRLRITVLAVLPGSKRAWRELCVSELRLWGSAPAALIDDATPRIEIHGP